MDNQNLPLVGYQAWVDWMGSPVLTLVDVWPEQPRAMIVGLNPAPLSVEAGHYYQGKVGQRQLRRLVSVNPFASPEDGRFFEASALTSGIGFTDIVKRPTRGEREVLAAEVHHGAERLASNLAERGVGLVICVFRHPLQALIGVEGPPGFQRRQTAWGAKVFRMPGPYAAAADVEGVMRTLALEWRRE